MISIDVAVTDLTTGDEFWVTLPVSNIKSVLRGLEPDYVMVSDCSDDVPFDVGSEITPLNEALMKCEDAGLNSLEEIDALMDAFGVDAVSSKSFQDFLEDTESFRQFEFDAKWPAMTDEQRAACWLATEQYITFGDLEIGDLVPVEDKLIDFIDWDAVWDDYESRGFHLKVVNDSKLIVTQIYQ